MKALALIARKRGTPRDAFRRHYEEVHSPLAVDTVLEGISRYVRHHWVEDLFGAPFFDVVTAFWYRDLQAALAVQKRIDGPEGEAIRADELTFMEKAQNTFFMAEERPVVGDEGAAAAFRAVALVRAPEGADPGGFAADYEARALPRLLEATEAPTWCLQHRALAMGDARPAFDVVSQVHAAAGPGLADWARALAEGGAEVVLGGVSEHESALPGAGGQP